MSPITTALNNSQLMSLQFSGSYGLELTQCCEMAQTTMQIY